MAPCAMHSKINKRRCRLYIPVFQCSIFIFDCPIIVDNNSEGQEIENYSATEFK